MVLICYKFCSPLFQEVTQSTISYWQKDRLRGELKGLKKKMDDLDKKRKAAIVAEVTQLAKQMIAENPNQKYIVHEFKAGSNAKVSYLYV